MQSFWNLAPHLIHVMWEQLTLKTVISSNRTSSRSCQEPLGMDTTFRIVPMSSTQWKHVILTRYLLCVLYVHLSIDVSVCSTNANLHTCAYEHYIILSVFCFYFIHHDLSELVVHICFDYDWSIVNGVDRVEHGWVASGKGYNFIRKVLSCVKSSKCLAWTLWRKIIVTL